MAQAAAALAPDTKRAGGLRRGQLIGSAGIVIMIISAAAALLRLGGPPAATVIGAMMLTAGSLEMIAGGLRARNRSLSVVPGLLTVAAGGLLAIHPLHRFVPSVWLVIGWLAARGVVLGAGTTQTRGSVRAWTMLAAGTDLALSAILLMGLSASTLTLTLFGLTSEILGSFASVVALSFVATGTLLVEVASCERD